MHRKTHKPLGQGVALALLTAACSFSHGGTYIGTDLHSANSANEAIAALLSANRGSNGGGDQSLMFGDQVHGSPDDDLLIGGLGIDVLMAYEGNDILIGGTEDFNSFNRDRAFGGSGDDAFLWAPGDGNDFFNGGEGQDVVILGLIGESQASPVFAVNPPNTDGSGDFDGIFIDENGNPQMDVINSPGFCEVVEADENQAEALAQVGLDHVVRFIIRPLRQAFLANPDADPSTQDDGLRIALHLQSVEYLVCASEAGGEIEILDLTQVPAALVDRSQLPTRAQRIVQDNLDREAIQTLGEKL